MGTSSPTPVTLVPSTQMTTAMGMALAIRSTPAQALMTISTPTPMDLQTAATLVPRTPPMTAMGMGSAIVTTYAQLGMTMMMMMGMGSPTPAIYVL